MADFSWITPRLATGAAISSPDDVNALADQGVTHIIDCRGEFDDAPLLASHPSMMYLWNGTNDDGATKPPEWFGKSLAFALPALGQPHSKIYTHCAAGWNRGPSTAFAILAALGVNQATVMAWIVTARPVCRGNVRYSQDAMVSIKALGYI